jgi:hypothetical protein
MRVQNRCPGAKAGQQMIRCCAWGIVAMACFTLNGAIGQAPFDIQHHAVAKTSVARQTPPSGNPLWGIPVGSLSTTRERPVFSASRRPPASPLGPVPVAEAPPPKPAEPEQPPFTLVGTSASHKMSRSLSSKRRKISFVCISVKRPQAGICVRSICGP